MSTTSAIVLDTGSTVCKAGLCVSNFPSEVFPMVIGRPKNNVIMKGRETPRTAYIGEDTIEQRGLLSINSPVVRGIVKNWDDVADIWELALLEKLEVVPTEHPIMFTHVPGSSTESREKMAEIAFEALNVPALCIGHRPVFSLTAAGLSTGVVVSSGGGVTNISTVYEGYLVPTAQQQLCVAGNDVSDRLMKLLGKRGTTFETEADKLHVDSIKEGHAYLALDYQKECKSAAGSFQQKRMYELPDGTSVVLKEERFGCCEGLFQPTLHGYDVTEPLPAGIHTLLHRCVESCDVEFRPEMYANIFLSGGNTLIPGFPERLRKELVPLVPGADNMIHITAPMNRQCSAWVGAAMTARHSSFDSVCVSKAEYEEVGPSVVHCRFI
jgi:actin-related protein